jgi:hypothetical protein
MMAGCWRRFDQIALKLQRVFAEVHYVASTTAYERRAKAVHLTLIHPGKRKTKKEDILANI